MDRGAWFRLQPWLASAASARDADSTPSKRRRTLLWRGCASFHYCSPAGDRSARAPLGALDPDALHIGFAASGPASDPMQCEVEVSVQTRGSAAAAAASEEDAAAQQQPLILLQLDGHLFELAASAICRLVASHDVVGEGGSDAVRGGAQTPGPQQQRQQLSLPVVCSVQRPASRPPFVSVLFRHVSLDLYPQRAAWSSAQGSQLQAAQLREVLQQLAASAGRGAAPPTPTPAAPPGAGGSSEELPATGPASESAADQTTEADCAAALLRQLHAKNNARLSSLEHVHSCLELLLQCPGEFYSNGGGGVGGVGSSHLSQAVLQSLLWLRPFLDASRSQHPQQTQQGGVQQQALLQAARQQQHDTCTLLCGSAPLPSTSPAADAAPTGTAKQRNLRVRQDIAAEAGAALAAAEGAAAPSAAAGGAVGGASSPAAGHDDLASRTADCNAAGPAATLHASLATPAMAAQHAVPPLVAAAAAAPATTLDELARRCLLAVSCADLSSYCGRQF